jgi:cytochrome c-type biogenesis protein CcmH/NrfG
VSAQGVKEFEGATSKEQPAMTGTNRSTSTQQWTSVQAYSLAVICLLVGIAAGWLIRGSEAPAATAPETASTPATSATPPAAATEGPTPLQLKQMADKQAAPLIERLKSDPNNANLLASVGNFYYDAQQYPIAIEYYQRALKVQPANTGVRTDMATAYWYTGNADTAIAEFQKSLSYEPNKPNTLFNLGIVEWQGKMNINAAVAAWQKLLDTNPNYEAKDKVLELMAQAKKHSSLKLGTSAKPLQN